jgi:hypothetical protein
MGLCIVGKQSLDDMEAEMVKKCLWMLKIRVRSERDGKIIPTAKTSLVTAVLIYTATCQQSADAFLFYFC